jgi:hypothetical protein
LGFAVRAGGGTLDHQAEAKSEKHADRRGGNQRNRNWVDNGSEGQPDDAVSPGWKPQRR